MIEKEEILVGSDKVILDPKNLNFNETNLNEYIIKEGSYYDNFGGYLARAERNLQICELNADEIYSERFSHFKQEGGSDKLCESRAKADSKYIDAKKEVVETKYLVNRLKNHLRAWDKNHDNAQSLGHMLRKEMDKLNMEIKGGSYYNGTDSVYGNFDTVDDIVNHVTTEENENE